MKLLLFLLLTVGVVPVIAQQKWRPYAGIHASGDAEMYYLGPSFQLGTDYYFNDRLGLTGYVHSYRRGITNTDPADYEKGHFHCLTGAVLFELRPGKKALQGLFLAGGLAVQQVDSEFDSSWAYWDERRTNVLPVIRIGYAFPLLQRHLITVEINATGPYQERKYLSTYTEIITQLSLGTRIIW
ncbi:hypothetical protein ACW9KT_07065 [Hymenobacter sp. HD11105]